MSIYQQALSIYEDSKDMDYDDYSESRDADISFIAALLTNIGEDATKALLTTM